MSSKLVKKGLEFLSSAKEISQEEKKKTLKVKQQGKRHKARKGSHPSSGQWAISVRKDVKAKKKKTEKDFTEQNLKYYRSSTWKINKDTYKKIIQHLERRTKKSDNKNEENEEEGEEIFSFD